MLVSLEGFSIIILGSWNPAIFSPKWIIGHLTDSKEIKVEFSFGTPGLPPQMLFDGMKLRVSSNRLELYPGDSDSESLQRAQGVASTILRQLEHTPISAVGVNFQWIEEEPPEGLKQLFRCPDRNDLADNNWLVNETSLSRSLNQDNHTLNLAFTEKADGQYLISANFHTPCNDVTTATNALSQGLSQLQDIALEMLHDVYGLAVL